MLNKVVMSHLLIGMLVFLKILYCRWRKNFHSEGELGLMHSKSFLENLKLHDPSQNINTL